MKKNICGPFYYIYEPELAKIDEDLEAGLDFEDLPDDWTCDSQTSFEDQDQNITVKLTILDSDKAGLALSIYLMTGLTATEHHPLKKQISNLLGKGVEDMKKYICGPCNYVYEPEMPHFDGDIDAGMSFEDLPDDWVCPGCGANKDSFDVVEE